MIVISVPQTSEIEHFYELQYKHFKFKTSDSQAYGNEDKHHWKVKVMNKDFRNYFVDYHSDNKNNNLSRATIIYCPNV